MEYANRDLSFQHDCFQDEFEFHALESEYVNQSKMSNFRAQ